MEFILDILYLYVAVYTIYFVALALRSLNDKPFRLEKKYAQYSPKENFAVIIYTHNNKQSLEALIHQLKMQDYPINSFKVFAILDNCTDGSEQLFQNERFVNVINYNNETLGKDQAVSLLLEQLQQDNWIDSFIFLDGNRNIANDFLTVTSMALSKNSVLCGETVMTLNNLDILEAVKAVFLKYHMNFILKARSLFGLATFADAGVLIMKKEIVASIGAVDFKDVNSELKYNLLLSKIGFKCIYNPNIQTFVNSEGYVFKRPSISMRFKLFVNCVKKMWTTNFVFTEHAFNLVAPNCWTLMLSYIILLKHSYKYYFFVDFRLVLISFILLIGAFLLSLINSKLSLKEMGLLLLYPIYSLGHMIKHFPPVKYLHKRCLDNKINENEKLSMDVVVFTGKTDLPCKLEFISDNGLSRVRFLFKNKKYTTAQHIRMVDALQELKTKLEDYGFVLKICSCCSHFTPDYDGTTNMLKGFCKCDYPSPSLREPKSTLIWNSCTKFSPSKLNSLIEEMLKKGSED